MLLRIYSKAQGSLESSSYGQDRENQWNTNFNLLHNFKILSLKTLQILGSTLKYKCRVQVFTFMAALNTTFTSTHGNQIPRSYSLCTIALFAMHTLGKGQWLTDVQEDYSEMMCFAWWWPLLVNLKLRADSRYMPSYLNDIDSKVHLNVFLT